MANLEGTPEFQRGFDALASDSLICPAVDGSDLSPYNPKVIRRQQLERMTRHIMESIVAESPYKPDMQWDLWHRANELHEQNALPDGITGEDVFQYYLRVFEGE